MRPTIARLAPPLLLVAALTLAGCSSSSDDDSAGGASAADASVADRAAPGSAAEPADQGADQGAAAGRPATQAEPADLRAVGRAVIRRGDVSFHAEDVARAQFEVRRIADRASGEMTEEQTDSDDDGRPAYAHMVLRIPTDDFQRTVDALAGLGEHATVSTSEDDVTTQLIDVRTRVAAQKRSIARITVLFDRAEDIGDIMAIESELSRRQADLDALERKRAYLTGQSAMSTITVNVERIPEKSAAKDHDTGFLAGLSTGWGALATSAVALATVVGALLPWLVVVALLGVPVLLLVRSARRRTPAVGTAQPAEAAGPAQSSE